MVRAVRSLAVTLGMLVAASRVEAQAVTALDSTARLPSESQVRVQLAEHGTAYWLAGMLARALPSQCVIVLVSVSGDSEHGITAYFTPSIIRIERWRGTEQGREAAVKADVSDPAEWAPYSLAALKRHEADEGCTDKNRNE
jgi:hypothetical protein